VLLRPQLTTFRPEDEERQRKMQSVPHNASTLPSELIPDSLRSRPIAMEEAVYKMVTVGAILLVLGSLWAF
jgi:hypothetical protein